jgi:2-aminoadipate transaminase
MMRGQDDRGRGRRTAHELARYEELFATRTRGMKSSAMREMMALTERPEVISLAGGLPDTSTFEPELYARLMAQVADGQTARALQYGPTEGMAAATECIAQVMAAEGTTIDPANAIVTTGGQQVIDLVCKTLIDPGDVIVAEAPTYPGAVPTFSAYQADVIQIEMDSEGMPIDELETVLDRLAGEGRRPKFIYTIPNFHNPAGVTMSLPRRRRLVEVARERELLVLEDNPYGLLRYEGEALPTLYSLDASLSAGGGAGEGRSESKNRGKASSDLVIYLGTFSKILSPGLRLGWAVAPRPVLEKLNLGKQGADLCSSPMTQLFVAAYFAEHTPAGTPVWTDYLDSLRNLYRSRRDVMLDALADQFGESASWTQPQGGLFIWATLPDYIDTTAMLVQALESEGVAFVPGRAAYVDGHSGSSSMRLNFAGTPEAEIGEGIRRIGKVVHERMHLFGSLTSKPSPRSPARTPQSAANDETDPKVSPAVKPTAENTKSSTGMADVFELPRRDYNQGRQSQSR